MLHIDTLTKFLERLPCPVEHRGTTKRFTVDKEWDTKSKYKQVNVPVVFVSTAVPGMNTWKWVYVGEVIL